MGSKEIDWNPEYLKVNLGGNCECGMDIVEMHCDSEKEAYEIREFIIKAVDFYLKFDKEYIKKGRGG